MPNQDDKPTVGPLNTGKRETPEVKRLKNAIIDDQPAPIMPPPPGSKSELLAKLRNAYGDKQIKILDEDMPVYRGQGSHLYGKPITDDLMRLPFDRHMDMDPYANVVNEADHLSGIAPRDEEPRSTKQNNWWPDAPNAEVRRGDAPKPRTLTTIQDLIALARQYDAHISALNISLNQGSFIRLGGPRDLSGIENFLPEGTVVIFYFENRMVSFVLNYGLAT
jgi:hypothetical protein